MAKAPQASPKASKSTVSVTYVPIHDDDRPKTKWNGIEFRANVPVELDPENPAHYVTQLVVKGALNSDGEMRTKAVESKVFMGEMAKANPSYVVDGKRARRKISTRVVPPPGAEWTEANEGAISEAQEVDVAATRDFMAA
jgi:hypothetical protein